MLDTLVRGLGGAGARVRSAITSLTALALVEAARRLGAAPGAYFMVGDYYEGKVVRTEAGWRFSRQTLHVTWFDDSPPSS